MEARYARNIPTLTPEAQAALGKKRVLLAGCGGLGGQLLELLLRVGVGAVTAVDPDRFEESNANRQVLCTAQTLGQLKVLAARERALSVRPDVDFTAVSEAISTENAPALLRECDLALDALDSVETRLVLADACAAAGIPLVHGAVAGQCAQVCTVLPGSGTLRKIYAVQAAPRSLSVLAPTCAACAAAQAAEAVRLLCGQSPVLAGKLMCMDLAGMEFHTLAL